MANSNIAVHRYAEALKTHRRNLHRIPELDRDLPKTKQYLLSTLEQLDCQLTFLCDSGICAFFDKGADQTYAFRSDMDALPVQEPATCEYRSTHEGSMHACGHDGHMAMALMLGEYVNALEAADCNVLLIFQPAEETLGGAEDICESGILKKYNVTRVFGIHLWPFLEAGKLTSKPGALMPKSAEINIEIHGETAHGTAPYEGCDALYIAAHYLRRTYTAHAAIPGAVPHFPEGVSDLPHPPAAPPEEKTLIHIGKMESGYVRNVVSDYAGLFGTVRTFSEASFDRIVGLLNDVLDEVAGEYGCRTSFSNSDGYPPVINDAALYAEILPTLEGLPSIDDGKLCCYEERKEPVMISDDFSFYGQYAPAVYFLLGTGTGIPLHSVDFDFDENILISGFELYKALLSC